jgi:hypothetical protein
MHSQDLCTAMLPKHGAKLGATALTLVCSLTDPFAMYYCLPGLQVDALPHGRSPVVFTS